MKKILIMILASKEYKYEVIQNAIRETWAVNPPENFNIKFYYGSKTEKQMNVLEEGDSIFCTYEETFENIIFKTIQSFDYAIKNYEFDYIFRCCNGSYLNLNILNELVKTLDSTNVYGGIIGTNKNCKWASGSGFIISKDVVEKLVSCKNVRNNLVDDLEIARILKSFNIEAQQIGKRYDIENVFHLNDLSHYHYHIWNKPEFMYKIHEKVKE